MTSSADYWVVYLQGAFQDTVFRSTQTGGQVVTQGDVDPQNEANLAVRGRTSAAVDLNGDLYLIGGSTIYRETIRDVGGFDCLAIIVVHETGHQFGLKDSNNGTMGIMEPCTANVVLSFTDQHIKEIRQRPHPQGG
jgi:hypothetical protein